MLSFTTTYISLWMVPYPLGFNCQKPLNYKMKNHLKKKFNLRFSLILGTKFSLWNWMYRLCSNVHSSSNANHVSTYFGWTTYFMWRSTELLPWYLTKFFIKTNFSLCLSKINLTYRTCYFRIISVISIVEL